MIHGESGDMIFHIFHAMWRRKIVKMVNLGKEIENDIARSETKGNSDHA